MKKFDALVLAAVFAAPALMAADTVHWPAPGLYQIDADTTFSTPQGANTTQHVDGLTGATTSEGRTYPGAAPNTFCVAHGTPSAKALAANRCRTLHAGNASATTCPEGTTVDETWQQIDTAHWKRHIHAETGAPSAAQWPEATRQAMAPVIAALEAQLKTGTPEEQTLARQQLDALRGPTAARMSTDTIETWTRIAETCE